jgi:hypothetical protein
VAALAAFVQAKKDHPIFRDQDAAYDTSASACQDVGVDGRFVAAPPPPTSLVDQDIINVAAVTSQVLRAPDLDIRDGTYWSFAGDTCPELFDCTNPLSSNILASRSSCFSPTGNALFVGEGTRATTPCAPGQPSDQCPPSNAAWKYIVAHETGHMVQAHAIGSLNDVLSIPMGAPPWCKCDHVGSSNHAHCLQSVDDASTAQVEGFAQFFASRIWNDREAPDCTFVYYKELMLGDPTAPGEATPPIANTVCPMLPALTGTVPAGFKIVSPPLRVDCRPQLNPQAPKSWRNEICRTPGTTDFNLDGVEWDWMNFFYDVNTVDAPAGTRFSMLDINNSYVQACGLANPTPVSPSQPCDANPNVSPSIPSFTPSFRSLQDAVGIRFQTAPDKINRFRDSAVTYGVDEN